MASYEALENTTLVAKATEIFSDFWARNVVSGATCDFGGAALLVYREPADAVEVADEAGPGVEASGADPIGAGPADAGPADAGPADTDPADQATFPMEAGPVVVEAPAPPLVATAAAPRGPHVVAAAFLGVLAFGAAAGLSAARRTMRRRGY